MPIRTLKTVWKDYDFTPLLDSFKNQTFTEQLRYLAFLEVGTCVTAYPERRFITKNTPYKVNIEPIPCTLDDESLKFVKEMFISQMSLDYQESMCI